MTEPTVVHLPTRKALREIVKLCIAHGNEEEFVATMETEGGFEVFSRFAIWRTLDLLTKDGANQELFPVGSADAFTFGQTYDIEGHARARAWLNRRLVVTGCHAISGQRSEGLTQRVVYLAVGTKLEAKLHRAPRAKKRSRDTARLMED